MKHRTVRSITSSLLVVALALAMGCAVGTVSQGRVTCFAVGNASCGTAVPATAEAEGETAGLHVRGGSLSPNFVGLATSIAEGVRALLGAIAPPVLGLGRSDAAPPKAEPPPES